MTDAKNTSSTPKQVPGKKYATGMAIATVLMIIGLTLSKSTGFLREIFIRNILGRGTVEAEAFYLGFRIPDLFFQLLVGGSIQAAITPSLARSIESGDREKGWRSVSIFITIISIIMLVVSLLGSLLSPTLIPLVFFDKSEAVTALGAQVSSALFPQIFFMMLAAFCIGILNAHKKFSSTAFGPTIYNIFVILSILLLGSQTPNGVVYPAIGVAVSALIYFLWQLFMARKEVRSLRFSINWRDQGFQNLFRIALPTMISASIVQVNNIIITAFTGGYKDADGILQSLSWAQTIWMIPYGIFAVAIGSVMLPSLSASFASGDKATSRSLFGRSLRNALFLTIPSAGLLVILSQDVVPGVLHWTGTYNPAEYKLASMILIGYCVAIVAQTFVFIYNQAFYAIGNTKVPLLVGALSMIMISGSCAILKSLGMLSSEHVEGAIALSLAYSLAGTVNAVILFLLYRRNKSLAPRGVGRFLIRAAICLAFMMLVLSTVQLIPFTPEGKVMQLLWLAVRGIIGVSAYLAAAKALQMRELRSFLDRFMRRRK